MSGKLMGQVYALKLTRVQRDVLQAICDHANDEGTGARPGVYLLAYKTDLSTRQVERYLREFRQRGIIKQVGGGGHGKAVEYVIDLSKAERKPPFKRDKSDDIQMSPESNHSADTSRPIRRHPEPNQTTFPAQSDDIQMSPQPPLEPSNNHHHNREPVVVVKSKHSREAVLAFVKYRKGKGDNIRSISRLTNYLLQTGESDDDIDEFLTEHDDSDDSDSDPKDFRRQIEAAKLKRQREESKSKGEHQ